MRLDQLLLYKDNLGGLQQTANCGSFSIIFSYLSIYSFASKYIFCFSISLYFSSLLINSKHNTHGEALP